MQEFSPSFVSINLTCTDSGFCQDDSKDNIEDIGKFLSDKDVNHLLIKSDGKQNFLGSHLFDLAMFLRLNKTITSLSIDLRELKAKTNHLPQFFNAVANNCQITNFKILASNFDAEMFNNEFVICNVSKRELEFELETVENEHYFNQFKNEENKLTCTSLFIGGVNRVEEFTVGASGAMAGGGGSAGALAGGERARADAVVDGSGFSDSESDGELSDGESGSAEVGRSPFSPAAAAVAATVTIPELRR